MKKLLTIIAVAFCGQLHAQCPALQPPFAAARGGITVYADAGSFTGYASAGNTIEGGVQLSGGTGSLSGDGSSTTGELSINGDLVLQNGAVLSLTTGAQLLVYGNIYLLGASTLTIEGGSALYYFGGQLQIESGSAVNGSALPVGSLRFVAPRPANGTTDAASGIARPADPNSGYNEAAPVSAVQYLDANSTAIVPALYNYNGTGTSLCNLDGVGTGNATTANMALQPSTSFNINGNTLTVTGAVSGTGTMGGSASSNLNINGIAGSLGFTTGAQVVKDLNLGNSASATLATPLDITAGAAPGSVTVASGAVLASGGNLVIKSDALGTARVAESAGSITGDVAVERFIPGGHRAWRLLTLPVSGTQTIRQAWANGAAPLVNAAAAASQPVGLGTLITGHAYTNGATANAAGFDWIDLPNVASSIRTYVVNGAGGSWPVSAAATPSLSTNTASAAQGYMLFIRGDRKTIAGTPNATTLRAKNPLKMGTRNYTIPASASAMYHVLGNPYACPIDFEDIMLNPGNAAAAKNDRFWIWDATNGVNGAYFLIKKMFGSWKRVPEPIGDTSNTLQFIQSSQAILVEPSATGGAFTINEEDKANPAYVTPLFSPMPLGQLYTNLLLAENNNNNSKLADGVLSAFKDGYSAILADVDDVAKMDNFAENIALQRDGKRLSIEARPLVVTTDTLFFAISNMKTRAYALQIRSLQMQDGLSAFLQDKFTGSSTPVSLGNESVTTYNFNVTSEPSAAAADRFKIIFKQDATLPIGMVATAYGLGNGVQVGWKTTNEKNIKTFEVEKSLTGNGFTKSATVAALSSREINNYGWYDATPAKGTNYYRIKSISADGNTAYSNVMEVKIGDTKPGFALYPSPVQDGNVTMQLSNLNTGKYVFNIYNVSGQLMQSGTIEHHGGSTTTSLRLGQMAAGVYKVMLGNGMMQDLVVE